jgi:hypothetical protein
LVTSSSYLFGSKMPRRSHIPSTPPTDDSVAFNARFSRYRRLLHFIANRVLGDARRADEAVGTVGFQRLAIHRGSSMTALFAAGSSECSSTKLWPCVARTTKRTRRRSSPSKPSRRLTTQSRWQEFLQEEQNDRNAVLCIQTRGLSRNDSRRIRSRREGFPSLWSSRILRSSPPGI